MTRPHGLDPYTGQSLTDSSEVDIDYVVPVANAWRPGSRSSGWSTADGEAYADDPLVPLSADDAANQTKGDKGPVPGSNEVYVRTPVLRDLVVAQPETLHDLIPHRHVGPKTPSRSSWPSVLASARMTPR